MWSLSHRSPRLKSLLPRQTFLLMRKAILVSAISVIARSRRTSTQSTLQPPISAARSATAPLRLSIAGLASEGVMRGDRRKSPTSTRCPWLSRRYAYFTKVKCVRAQTASLPACDWEDAVSRTHGFYGLRSGSKRQAASKASYFGPGNDPCGLEDHQKMLE